MIDELLKMIEEVDPSDTAKLDEIDARVWCFLNDVEFKKPLLSEVISKGESFRKVYGYRTSIGDISTWYTPKYPNLNGGKWFCYRLKFTKSRDALKAIRPEGYVIGSGIGGEIGFHGKYGYEWGLLSTKEFRCFCADNLPTEELAELHAILQAIDYERKNK